MSRVRQRSTLPEQVVRMAARRQGIRYRVNNGDLAGSPDLANRTKKWAIFVHGCFWHRHKHCSKASMPKNNRTFWTAKFQNNIERDKRVAAALRKMGFQVLVIWECETRDPAAVEKRVATLSRRRDACERSR